MKTWIFDFDNTLIESFPHYLGALESVLSEFGQKFVTDSVHDLASKPAHVILKGYLPADLAALAHARLSERSMQETHLVPTYPRMKEVLTSLKDRGCHVGIWTNRDQKTLRAVMQANAIHHLVDEVATADCVTKLKPDPEGLEMLAARFECEPSQMVVIGDHVHDMTGAKKFGATAVRARWCGLVPDDCLLADHQFLDVGGIEKWVHSQF